MQDALRDELLRLFDQRDPRFRGFPMETDNSGLLDWDATEMEAGTNFGEAARSYFESATIPAPSAYVPFPPAHITAAAAMAVRIAAELRAGREAHQDRGIEAIRLGFETYASTLALLANPLAGQIVPPPALVFPGLGPTSDPREPAENIAAAVHAWALTGLFVPPFSPPLTWI